MSKGNDPEDLKTTTPFTMQEEGNSSDLFDAPTEAYESGEEDDDLLIQGIPVISKESLKSAQIVHKDGHWVDNKTGKVIQSLDQPIRSHSMTENDEALPPKTRKTPSFALERRTESQNIAKHVDTTALMTKGVSVEGSALSSEQVAGPSAVGSTTSKPMGFEAFVPKTPQPDSLSALEYAVTSKAQDQKKKVAKKSSLKRSASSSVSSNHIDYEEENADFSVEWHNLIETRGEMADSEAKVWLGMEVKRYVNTLFTHVQYGSGRRSQVAAHFFNVLFRLYLDIGDVNAAKQRNAYTDLTMEIANRVVRAVCAIANTKVQVDQFTAEAISRVRSNVAFLNATDLSDMEKDYLHSKLSPNTPSYQHFATVFASFCNIAVVQKRHVTATLLAYSLFCICKVVDLCTDPRYLQDDDNNDEVEIPSPDRVTHSVMRNCHSIMDLLLLQRLSGGDQGLIDEARASGLSQSVNNFTGRRPPPSHTRSSPSLMNTDSALFKSLHNKETPSIRSSNDSQERSPTAQLASTMDGPPSHSQGGGCILS